MLENLTLRQLFATFFGLYILAAGIGLLVDRNGFESFIDELQKSTPLAHTIAIFVFSLGAITVSIHNIWSGVLEGFVSLIGWGMLVEGILMLAFRRPILRIVRKIPFTAATTVPFGIGTIVLGAQFLNLSYVTPGNNEFSLFFSTPPGASLKKLLILPSCTTYSFKVDVLITSDDPFLQFRT